MENRVLRARARGEVSADAAFELLYREYARTVSAWLAIRADVAAVDDLAQDVWLIFYTRFRQWEFGTEMESPEARPVLSFLFRTCVFVARGARRVKAARLHDPLEDAVDRGDAPVVNGRESVLRRVEATRALALAERVLEDGELDVLLGKLVGLSAREIAESLTVTESVVDHRYRNGLSKLRKALKLKGRGKHG